MLEARRILEKNPEWTLDDVAQVSHLRPEYFDEVPETAIFLRPTDTETLFRDSPRLRFRWQPGSVAIQIETPRLKSETLLPADWLVIGQRVKASTNPVPIPLHSGAFRQDLALKLIRAGEELKSFRLGGLAPWGLWSESGGSFISLQARELPMDDYVLVSKSPLDFANRDGWLGDDADETRWNQEAQMPDGSTCFVSRLVPDARRAALEVAGWHRITFAPRARLELRVFPRVTERFFLTFNPPNSIALPAWPRFVLKAPKGLLANTADETQNGTLSDAQLWTLFRRPMATGATASSGTCHDPRPRHPLHCAPRGAQGSNRFVSGNVTRVRGAPPVCRFLPAFARGHRPASGASSHHAKRPGRRIARCC